MRLTDLTVPMRPLEPQWDEPAAPPRLLPPLTTRVWTLGGPTPAGYHARVHYYHHWSMAGTYIDLPGHILETDDGHDAATVPAEALFRVPAGLVRLDRSAQPGPVHAADLQQAASIGLSAPALVLNALGPHRFDAVPERTVYLARDAVHWIIDHRVRLLVSDVYESNDDPQDVFRTLFRAGIAAVCCPESLGTLALAPLLLSALPLRIPGATQSPCRLLAEQDLPGLP